ncbi:MAG: LysR family transcriptional regulator [Polyangiaceae bacterium]|nr:LysR family transcriptional regulator [Polyangiaceae bacterium]
MDLNEIAIFAKVVQTQSFTEAGRAIGLPKSTVSRKVSELEDRLGTLLLQRTTRKLSLTDAGRAYYQYASRIMSDVEEAGLAVSNLQGAPRGLLRVTTPLAFDLLAPIVAEYMARYPEVHVEMVCTDRLVDIVDEGFDLAVRAGRLTDSSLIVRHLGSSHSVVVASPAFLKTHGIPKRPQELERFPAVVFGAGADRGRWTLLKKEDEVTVQARRRLVANDFRILHEAAVAGIGIALLPALRCHNSVQEKRLQVVLPGWRSPDTPFQAIYPSTRLLSPKVKTFVEHLQERFAPVLSGVG